MAIEQQKGVAGYYRVSQARDDMHAPELYEDEIRRYCLYKKVELARIYSDIDYSAFRGAKPRPALQSLIEHRHAYGAVVIPKLSRFGRSMKELIRLFDIFDSDGIPLVFLDMNLDTSTSQGRLLRHVLAAFAEYESDIKSDYSRANHRRMAEQGLPWGGNPPYGFEKHPRERQVWRVVPHEADVIREVFARYAAGQSQTAIARALNERGIRLRSGQRWESWAVGHQLDRPAAAGLRRLDDGYVRATWDAIVDAETWNRVQDRRAVMRRVRHGGTRPKPGAYLLTGLLVCGTCGRRTHHRSQYKGRAPAYQCSGRQREGCRGGNITAPRAEKIVVDAYLERFAKARISDHHGGATSVAELWERSGVTERRELLSLAITRIDLIPRQGSDPSGKGHTRGRDLMVHWTDTSDRPVLPSVLPLHRPVSKICARCGYRKPLKEFLQDATKPDGRGSVCVVCRRRPQAVPKPELPRLVPEPPRRQSWSEWRREHLLPK